MCIYYSRAEASASIRWKFLCASHQSAAGTTFFCGISSFFCAFAVLSYDIIAENAGFFLCETIVYSVHIQQLLPTEVSASITK